MAVITAVVVAAIRILWRMYSSQARYCQIPTAIISKPGRMGDRVSTVRTGPGGKYSCAQMQAPHIHQYAHCAYSMPRIKGFLNGLISHLHVKVALPFIN